MPQNGTLGSKNDEITLSKQTLQNYRDDAEKSKDVENEILQIQSFEERIQHQIQPSIAKLALLENVHGPQELHLADPELYSLSQGSGSVQRLSLATDDFLT